MLLMKFLSAWLKMTPYNKISRFLVLVYERWRLREQLKDKVRYIQLKSEKLY